MRAKNRFLSVLASIALLSFAHEAKSEEFQGFDQLFFDLISDMLPPFPVEVHCSSLSGAEEMIKQSGGAFSSKFVDEVTAFFNASSLYHCEPVPHGQVPDLKFLRSHKDSRGVTWHLYTTQSFGTISFLWRKPKFPYA